MPGGIQSWVVPATGTYLIEADGAAGGTQQYTGSEGSGTISPGGFGASIQGIFQLTAGETIYLLVGQMGSDTKEDTRTGGDWESAGPGGGGGTFVYRNAGDALPLIAAGGGWSGSNCVSVDASLQNASTSTSGNTAANVNGGSNPLNALAGARSHGSVTIPAQGANTEVVPTMSAYGLVLTVLGLLIVARRRLRPPAKGKL